MIIDRMLPRGSGTVLTAAALGAALLLVVPAEVAGQKRGGARSEGGARTSGSVIGDVFFGADHVAQTRDRIHGRSLVQAAIERNRRAEEGRRFRQPGSELGRPTREPEPEARRRPVRRRFVRHPSVRRFVVIQPRTSAREEPASRVDERAEPRRALRSPDLLEPGARSSAEPTAGVPTATAGEIGRHLRTSASGADEGAARARRCVDVQLETRSGIGFRTRVNAGALDASGPREIGLLLRLLIDEGEPLVLPGIDGETMKLPAGVVDAVVVGPCR